MKKNVWKITFTRRMESYNMIMEVMKEEFVVGETIEDAIKVIRLWSDQKEWVDFEIISVEFSHSTDKGKHNDK